MAAADDRAGSPIPDPRHIANGLAIPTENYCDQPYIVRTDDGAWLCTVTSGGGREGQPGQHVLSMRSTDCGRSWSPAVPVEPTPPGDGPHPESSYSVLLKAPSGRIFCFYNHNTDNVREVIADDPPFKGGVCKRVDSLGFYVLRFTDDHGRSWSASRYPIPVRLFAIDRENPYGGGIRFFWNVGRPFVHGGAAYVSLHKVGRLGHGLFARSEGVLLRSANLLSEPDPADATWETLPDGEIGLRTPPGGGPIAEEHCFVPLSDGSFYCVYRSIDGYPVCCYSRDGGHAWTAPQYQRYADGRPMKHPRAANFVWRCSNGKYLYWFHNNGGRFVPEGRNEGSFGYPYQNRNPAWLCGGVEADSPEGRVIRWSQPEIVLYDDDPLIRMSYPDLVEQDGRFFVTETQKFKARVHEVDPGLIEGLWGQFSPSSTGTLDGLLLEWRGNSPAEIDMPELPHFVARDMSRFDHGARGLRQGFTIELLLQLDGLAPCQTVLDWRRPDGRGGCLATTDRGTLELSISDGQTRNAWDCDPGVLIAGRRHRLTVIVDGGPRIILFVVDGRLCDGGRFRQFGWGRFSPDLLDANGWPRLRVAPCLKGSVKSLRIYGRALRISEAIANAPEP